jgi:penicillin-binding protein 1A
VAGLQSSRGVGGFLSNLFNGGPQASNAPPPTQLQSAQAPVPQRPIPPDNGYRPPPTRASAPPPNPNARPEAASGLDGWLVDRLFGGNR